MLGSVERICQDHVGRCSFIDVLEEASLRKTRVAISLRDGTAFIDKVKDVVTENHEDYAIFENHDRVAVTEVASATRAPHR